MGIHIRRGELTMIAGPPGSGKSTLALDWALKARVPTLYFSADTHQTTMRMRSLAMLSGLDQTTEVEPLMATNEEWCRKVLAQADHVGWNFESAPSLRDIELEVAAHREVWGADPELIVLDNLTDCAFENGDEYGTMRALLRELKWWARDTDAAVLVLHHTSMSVEGDPAPPLSALHGKVAQTPAVVLTIVTSHGLMGICPVKNRYGRATQDGSWVTWLRYNPATMQITDVEDR